VEEGNAGRKSVDVNQLVTPLPPDAVEVITNPPTPLSTIVMFDPEIKFSSVCDPLLVPLFSKTNGVAGETVPVMVTSPNPSSTTVMLAPATRFKRDCEPLVTLFVSSTTCALPVEPMLPTL
jgi:hypothetical protein